MQNKKESFNNINPPRPPRGLFARIIRRLGLEKQLGVARRHLGFFAVLLGVFLFLSIFAFVGLRQVLTESSFGPYLSLILSDPGIVLKYWDSFLFSIFESMPGAGIALFLTALALLLLLVKLASSSLEKFHLVVRSIRKSRFVSRQSRD